MPSVTKLSVSVPTRVWNDVERLLGRPGETRSALVTRVLHQATRAARDAAILAEYQQAYREQPESDEERAVHTALLDTTRRRFKEVDRQEVSMPRAAGSSRKR